MYIVRIPNYRSVYFIGGGAFIRVSTAAVRLLDMTNLLLMKRQNGSEQKTGRILDAQRETAGWVNRYDKH